MSQIATGTGSGFPPDTSIARSSLRVLHAVNRRVRLFDSTGGIFGTRTLNDFFGAVGSLGETTLFDPKVTYDRATGRYFAVALQGANSSQSRLWLAVSRSGNPGSLSGTEWCRYYFDARVTYSGVPTWADYPGLGTGPNALVVTTNQFGNTQGFQSTTLRVWPKGHYANNASSCPAWRAPYNWYTYGASSSRLPFTMQPVQHQNDPTGVSGALQPAYLVNSVWGTRQYQVWKVANLASGSPLLFGPTSVTGSTQIQNPPLAPGGATYGVATGDARVLQAAGLGNRVHLVHTNACQFTGGTAESCVRYAQLSVSNGTGGSLLAGVAQQSLTGGGDGWFYAYPSIAVNNSGTVASAFNASSVGGYRGSAWAVKPAASSTLGGATWLAQGTCLLSATYQLKDGVNLYRAGDYSGAASDPDGVSLWVASERSSNITGVGCGWQTTIGRITGT